MKAIFTTLFASILLSGFAFAGECEKCKKHEEIKEEEAIAGECEKCKKHEKIKEEEALLA